MWGKRAGCLAAVVLATLGAGCCHTSDQERMDELLHQSDTHGPPGEAQWIGPAPSEGDVEPERVHGGII